MTRTRGAGLAVALIAFLVYLATLCPTIFAGDAGELAAAAATLGIAHPPGYPLWTMMGNVFVRALPGEPAWALNLFSALCAAGAAGLMAALLTMWTGRALVSAGVALAFALSRAVWQTATVTEVYALNLLFTMLALTAAVAARRGSARWLGLAAYALGLGTANHPFVLLAGAPVLALAVMPGRPGPGRPASGAPATVTAGLRRLPWLAVVFVLGLSAYVYLPVRVAAGPDVNWGGLRSLADVWDHVTRAQYGGLGDLSAHASLFTRLRVLAIVLARSVPAPLWLLGAAGFVALARQGHSRRAMLLAGFLALAGPVTAGVLRFDDTFLDRSVVTPFFLPAVAALFLPIGVGAVALETWLRGRLRAQGVAAVAVSVVVALALPGFLGVRNGSGADRRGATLARDWAERTLAALPERSLLFASGDNAMFSLRYAQDVLGRRPDVTLLDRTLNLNVAAWGPDFPAMSRVERRSRRDERERELVFGERDRAVFFTEGTQALGLEGCRVEPNGPLEQVLRPGERPVELAWTPTPLPRVDPDDFLEVHFAAATLYREGRWLARTDRPQEAVLRFEQAASLADGIPSILRNIGLERLEMGDFEAAERHFLRSVELEPRNEDALYNLAVLTTHTDRPGEALGWYERLEALETEYPEVPLGHGVALVRLGRLEEARAQARRALTLAPDLSAARELLMATETGLELGGEAGILEAQRLLGSLGAAGTLQLAERYLERGDVERATQLYREAATQTPESIEASYGLGYGLLHAGQYEAAAEAFRRVLEINPESADGRNALAYVFAQTGDSLRTAERLATEALELDPELAAYWNDTLGWVRYRAGEHRRALETLQVAADTLPEDDEATRAENEYHIGSALLALGRREEAGEWFRRAADRSPSGPWVADLQARLRDQGSAPGMNEGPDKGGRT
jgi:tetratricopeptide (TPR) repeat protein